MNLTTILCVVILLLLIVIIALLINLKNKNNNSDSLRQEISTMLMHTREELLNNISTKISENGNTQQLQLANLTNINELVKLEKYEEAAKVRDEIKKIEADE